MQEIRFHGRGGQGTVLASVVLAKAFFTDGLYVQTFPVFGVERRGAPVEAYLRLDDKKILIRSNVYKPDHVVVQDVKLLHTLDVSKGLKPGGWILLNMPDFPPDISARFSDYRLAAVDASGIAMHHKLGTRTQPIINTAMCGAFARVMGKPSLDALEKAVFQEIPVKQKENFEAAKAAYESVKYRAE